MIRRGATLILLVGAALASGCARGPAVEVHAVGTPPAGAANGDAVALARTALAMGNTGLALQQFRQELRAHPGSTDALSGIASCYDAMGRIDLSRRYYEEALALAPGDTALLRGYANALARHGAAAEAQALINEIALRTRAPAAQWVIEPAAAAAALAVPPVSDPLAPVATTQAAAPPASTPNVRLERVSLGEIALITSGAPVWKALPAPTPARSVRLLNAARRQGLAARHREQLRGAGWRSVAIGDAPHTRQSSLILYPASRSDEARRLANSLRIAAMRPQTRADILILLGRDRG